jgi:nucleotide-binding universal stress UspA family protein
VHDASVTLLRVLEAGEEQRHIPFMDPLDLHLDSVVADAYLAEVAQRLSKAGVLVNTATLNGSAADQIVGFARRADVDLIVISSHGKRGPSEWNVSSVTQKVMLRASRSLMIVRAYESSPQRQELALYRRLLVPLDGSPRAEYVLPAAVSLARAHDAGLVLAHVVREPERPRHLWPDNRDASLVEQLIARKRRTAKAYLEGLCTRLPVEAQPALLTSSDVCGALQDLAERRACDLVMLSAHGYSGSPRRMYGGVATGLIGHGTAPLLIVQDLPQGRIEPLTAELAIEEHKGH